MVEAAELKHLIPVVWKLATELLNTEDPYEELIVGALAGSTHIEEILEKATGLWALSPKMAADFSKACQTINLSLTQLGLLSHPGGVALWNFTIKNHCLEHVSLEGAELSPRLTWNYSSEGLMVHIRNLIVGKRTQPSVFALQCTAMEHWLAGFESGMKPFKL